MKDTSIHFNLPLTTLASKLEVWGLYPWNKRTSDIELTEENLEYIKTHSVKEIALYFHIAPPRIRSFLNKRKIPYKRNEKIFQDKSAAQKARQEKYIELHKNMSYEDIAKLEGITKSRVSQIILYGY